MYTCTAEFPLARMSCARTALPIEFLPHIVQIFVVPTWKIGALFDLKDFQRNLVGFLSIYRNISDRDHLIQKN
jgi:hypothetical protein